MNIKKLFDKEVESILKVAQAEAMSDLADALRIALRSPRALMVAKQIRQRLHEQGIVAEDGTPIEIGDPSELANSVEIRDGQIFMALTEAEDRWVRADQLFGDDILGELGIKYTSA